MPKQRKKKSRGDTFMYREVVEGSFSIGRGKGRFKVGGF